jgi:hypothetical protein
MTQNTDKASTAACSTFLDQLDAWLTGEIESEQMWTHHDNCASCRMEARLAREIGGIMTALPELTGPEIRTPATKVVQPGRGLLDQLLGAWRQPLVFVPALALVLAVLLMPQWRATPTAVEPELVIIDGQEYTREEIRKAAADLELALRYIDRYGPSRVISAELDNSSQRPPSPEADSDDVPTI